MPPPEPELNPHARCPVCVSTPGSSRSVPPQLSRSAMQGRRRGETHCSLLLSGGLLEGCLSTSPCHLFRHHTALLFLMFFLFLSTYMSPMSSKRAVARCTGGTTSPRTKQNQWPKTCASFSAPQAVADRTHTFELGSKNMQGPRSSLDHGAHRRDSTFPQQWAGYANPLPRFILTTAVAVVPRFGSAPVHDTASRVEMLSVQLTCCVCEATLLDRCIFL